MIYAAWKDGLDVGRSNSPGRRRFLIHDITLEKLFFTIFPREFFACCGSCVTRGHVTCWGSCFVHVCLFFDVCGLNRIELAIIFGA